MNNRTVAVLFSMDEKNYATTIDNRSRNRFKRLIKNWGGAAFDKPQEGEAYEYINLATVLNNLENTYKELEKTPAVERIAKNVYRLIDQIKVHNDDIFEEDENDDEEEEED